MYKRSLEKANMKRAVEIIDRKKAEKEERRRVESRKAGKEEERREEKRKSWKFW